VLGGVGSGQISTSTDFAARAKAFPGSAREMKTLCFIKNFLSRLKGECLRLIEDT
jgi:hypothetical protein